MDTITIVCPNCRSRLSVQNAPDIRDKMLSCPICKFKAKVNVYMMGTAAQGGLGATDEAVIMYLKTPLNKPILDALKRHVYPEFAIQYEQPTVQTVERPTETVEEPPINPPKTTRKTTK